MPTQTTLHEPTTERTTGVHRIEVHPKSADSDPLATFVLRQARQVCEIAAASTCRVYLIEAPFTESELTLIGQQLLADPICERAVIGSAPVMPGAVAIEVHYRPGVMDPVAQSARTAIAEMVPHLAAENIQVRTGLRYDLRGPDLSAQRARQFVEMELANPVIQHVDEGPFHPSHFPRGSEYTLQVVHVPICQLDDAGLAKLSRTGHLFLSVVEMRAIRDRYRQLGREPTDIELETFAQTWSEHCVHKTFKSTVRYRQEDDATPSPRDWVGRPGHELHEDGSITITNLFKSTIVAATQKLTEDPQLRDWCVSVFADNAGIVRFDDEDGIAVKVETHNHPSAIEPYGGSATGIGGCIRDILGTGLAARPIANTDSFAVAHPVEPTLVDPGAAEEHAPRAGSQLRDVPSGVIQPRRILQQVVAGVRDYGNRMGIPTINGLVYFDDDYMGNPLIFAGCVGLIPLKYAFGKPQPADRIIVLGGRTGRDGIHGATFSSAELTDTHNEEFSHAVQIGNAITQKKMLDVILSARDHEAGPLFRAITDCGAGGFSSAVGELGQEVGARVTLESAPLKYQGLSYAEIWISEAQERMVLAVPPTRLRTLRGLCEAENVELCDLGQFGATDRNGRPQLVLTHEGTEVGAIGMSQLHDAVPSPIKAAHRKRPSNGRRNSSCPQRDIATVLRALLAHPNIASKHWIVRQYDHEVQGGSVVKPLVGLCQDGPSDAAVIRPKAASQRGVAVAAGMQPGIGEKSVGKYSCDGDSYWMALASIDEAVRNVVSVGADPQRIAFLDNFCWPSCDDPEQLATLVRALEACYDGAMAYRIPFVSGKDSLNNQFTTDDGQVITIPPTLLITAVGIVHDIEQCVTMDAKNPGDVLLIAGSTTTALGGSHYSRVISDPAHEWPIPRVDLKRNPQCARGVAQLIRQGDARAVHDCSDGGLLVAAAEMAFAGRVGLEIDLGRLPGECGDNLAAKCFAETPGRYLLEIEPHRVHNVTTQFARASIPCAVIGRFVDHDHFIVDKYLDEAVTDLLHTWRKCLDW